MDFIKNFTKTHCELLFNIWRIIRIFAGSLISTWIIVYLWYRFQDDIYIFFKLNKDVLAPELGSDLIVLTPALLYGGLQSFVLNRILGQNSRIRSSIDILDAYGFLAERDRRTPALVHVTLFFLTVVVISMLGLYKFCTTQVAIFAIGECVFVAMLAFFVALELDNPFDGANRIPPDKIPEGWMKMTIYDIIEGKVTHVDNGSLNKKREDRLSA